MSLRGLKFYHRFEETLDSIQLLLLRQFPGGDDGIVPGSEGSRQQRKDVQVDAGEPPTAHHLLRRFPLLRRSKASFSSEGKLAGGRPQIQFMGKIGIRIPVRTCHAGRASGVPRWWHISNFTLSGLYRTRNGDPRRQDVAATSTAVLDIKNILFEFIRSKKAINYKNNVNWVESDWGPWLQRGLEASELEDLPLILLRGAEVMAWSLLLLGSW